MGQNERERVLILCTGNSCRSQMAEAMLRRMAGNRFEVFSAGTEPAPKVHPLAVKAMAEIGYDISGHRTKRVADLPTQEFDYVITVCDAANQQCPFLPGQFERLHWPFDDPARAEGSEEERMAVFRRVREEMRAKLGEWVGEA